MRRSGFMFFAWLLAGCNASQTAIESQSTATASAGQAVIEADDTNAWQGTWNLVSCISDGEFQPAEMQWVVDGHQYTIRLDGQSDVDEYPFELDSRLKRIDVHHHDTPAGTYGGHFKGIYAIDGNSLKVCYDLKGARYPDSFDAAQGSGHALFEFQRQ